MQRPTYVSYCSIRHRIQADRVYPSGRISLKTAHADDELRGYNSVLYLEIVENGFIIILRRKTSICQETGGAEPFAKSPIIEHLQFFGYNKRNYTMTETLLEHYQPTDTPIAVLKRMYCFEVLVEIKNVMKFH